MNTIAKIQSRSDVADHLNHLRGRYDQEGLSRLELKIRYQSLGEDLTDAAGTPDAQLLELERTVVLGLLEESAPAMPEPTEVVQELRRTNPDAAEALEHQMNIEARKEALADAEQRIAEANENGWAPESPGYQRLLQKRDAAQQDYDAVKDEAAPPLVRESQAREYGERAESLRFAAAELLDSPEPGIVQQGREMMEQADEHAANAEMLRTRPVRTPVSDPNAFADASAAAAGLPSAVPQSA